MEVLEAVMKWIVAPVAAFVFIQYWTQHGQDNDDGEV